VQCMADIYDVLVKQDDVRLPDFLWHNTNDVDAGEVTWFPLQLIVVPQLHTRRATPASYIIPCSSL